MNASMRNKILMTLAISALTAAIATGATRHESVNQTGLQAIALQSAKAGDSLKGASLENHQEDFKNAELKRHNFQRADFKIPDYAPVSGEPMEPFHTSLEKVGLTASGAWTN